MSEYIGGIKKGKGECDCLKRREEVTGESCKNEMVQLWEREEGRGQKGRGGEGKERRGKESRGEHRRKGGK